MGDLLGKMEHTYFDLYATLGWRTLETRRLPRGLTSADTTRGMPSYAMGNNSSGGERTRR